MHCKCRQQNRLAKLMVAHFDSNLLQYDELVATGRAAALSPYDLRCRVLVKGKVKRLKELDERDLISRTSSSRCIRALQRCASGVSTARRSNSRSSRMSAASPRSPRSPSLTLASSQSDLQNRERTSDHRDSMVSIADNMVETSTTARRKLDKKLKADKNTTDKYFSLYLSLRSEPVSTFLGQSNPKSELPIFSINEDRLLKELGVSISDRNLIEGLLTSRSQSEVGIGLTEEQQTSRAIVRLAARPPPEVKAMQQRTEKFLLRPYPLGLRFSGKNMSPLPCWLAGAQHVCLNFSDTDTAVELHFALFDARGGYVLKPKEMASQPPSMVARAPSVEMASQSPSMQMRSPTPSLSRMPSAVGTREEGRDQQPDEDRAWPPHRRFLHCVTLHVISLHNLPKRGERRPRYSGSRSACHDYHPELSGKAAPPDNRDPSSPELSLSLHPIGGFCALSTILPLEMSGETEVKTRCVLGNGMNAAFVQEVHCVAAEPDATFLRASVTDGGLEVAYETAVLGRLRCGYRVLHLRGLLGTRIELAFLFVRVRSGLEPNMWQTPRQLRIQSLKAEAANKSGKSGEAAADKEKLHQDQVARLRAEVARLKQKLASRGEEAGEGED
mmetsp:Transcript_18234/g.49267  ORF Transcript_18234/g.49267 Transcript_18234/m.49267 type:complete len:614 (+) Transcript_18234:1-1842(+)